MEHQSKIFTPYRSLGLVSNEIPLFVRYINVWNENIIATVIGNAFQTYDEHKLRLVDVGNVHTSPILCLSGDTFHIYSACENKVYAWRRTTELVHSYSVKATVTHILPFGPHILVVDKKNAIYIFEIKSEELYSIQEFSEDFEISAILHPSTYINKILLGSKQGQLQIINIKSNKLIYTFNGWGSEVRVLVQSPAQDVVGIGLQSGDIYVHNLKFDETIVKFKQEWGSVTAMSFRTDGIPLMATGSELGHIAIWNLHERSLFSQIWDAHKNSVCGLQFLPNEPRMVTSSNDNTLKIWIFDTPDGGARLHMFKEGHSAPPLMVRFHGSLGNNILTAGEDATMRQFSVVADIVNRSLGQASYNSKAAKKKYNRNKFKMPAIIAFSSEAYQEKPWDNIACVHRNLSVVTTWSFEKQRMGDHKILHNRFKVKHQNVTASSLDVSVCGNYLLIGYDSGHLDKYNIQSAIWKGSCHDPKRAHTNIICGVVSGDLNQTILSGCQDGYLKWWTFKTLKKFHQIKFEFGLSRLSLHKESGLLGIALENWTLAVVDIDSRKVIRRFLGHKNQITDLALSSNSKWLVSSSLDRTIRTWDLPSGTCVDVFNVPVAASSISFSPVDEFLATTHAGHLGVCLWANRGGHQHLSLTPLETDYVGPLIPLPSMGAHESRIPNKKGIKEEMKTEEDMETEEYKSVSQITDEMITLSLMPTSRWLNLRNIEMIKLRNKPVEPPKLPKAAPFFIPTVPGLDINYAGVEKSEDVNENTKIKFTTNFEVLSDFGKLLKDNNYEEAIKSIMSMGPSAIDIEIRALDPDNGGSEEILYNFLEMIKSFISKKLYYDVCQGYLSLFLKVHADILTKDEKFRNICEKLLVVNSVSWNSMQNHLNKSLSLISYLKNAAILNY